MANETTDDPIRLGTVDSPAPSPATVVILGGTGDLTKRKLLPALYNLLLDGILPDGIAVVGCSRRSIGDDGFRELAEEAIGAHSRRPCDHQHWPGFAASLFYHAGELDDLETFRTLAVRLGEIEKELGLGGNRIFYLAVPPSLAAPAAKLLHEAGLIGPEQGTGPYSRVIVEKPIGHDLESARAVNAAMAAACHEDDVFRIDHYLGKETVQNIMVMRFANSIFEPLFNQKYIDHVQITVAEEVGVGTRGGYYEEAGALRDMVQNHILQLLSLTAMEPPWTLTAGVVRDHKLEVLRCLRPIGIEEVKQHVVRAQYVHGIADGKEVPGYRREERVDPDSTTETFVAMKVFIDNWRWAGVPFYLRTGKRMAKRASEIAITFKRVPQILFNSDPSTPIEPNVLTLRLQPDEGLAFQIATKVPGPQVNIIPVEMDFRYGSEFGDQSPEAYERLLLDVMAGDATLFMRRDAVEASWTWVSRILDAWETKGLRWIPEYAAGSLGPVEAARLIEEDGRAWRIL